MDVWFEKTMQMSCIFYEMKLKEYEEACAATLAAEVDGYARQALKEEMRRKKQEKITLCSVKPNPNPSNRIHHPTINTTNNNNNNNNEDREKEEVTPCRGENNATHSPDPNLGGFVVAVTPPSDTGDGGSPQIPSSSLGAGVGGTSTPDTHPPPPHDHSNHNHNYSNNSNGSKSDSEDIEDMEISDEILLNLQRKEALIATHFLDRMQFRKPIRAAKKTAFIDAIEEEKEFAYSGLDVGYRLVPADLEVVHRNVGRHCWTGTSRCLSHASSVRGEEFIMNMTGPEDPLRLPSPPPAVCAWERELNADPSLHRLLETYSQQHASDEEEEVERGALLYGEITSKGTRQLYYLFASVIEESVQEAKRAADAANHSNSNNHHPNKRRMSTGGNRRPSTNHHNGNTLEEDVSSPDLPVPHSPNSELANLYRSGKELNQSDTMPPPSSNNPSNNSSSSNPNHPQPTSDNNEDEEEDEEENSLSYREATAAYNQYTFEDTTLISETYEKMMRRLHKEGVVQVGLDIGCGTGKLLYEWSRLAAEDSAYCTGRETPSSSTSGGQRAAVLESSASSLTSKDPNRYSYMPYLAMVRTPCTSIPNSHAASLNVSKPWANQSYFNNELNSGADQCFPTTVPLDQKGGTAPEEQMPTLRGWLGVGVEVVPSRMYVTRQALAPYYLDLVESEQLLVAGRVANSRRPPVPHFDPAPPRAVACPHQDPKKRRPTSCVLLYEGDVLTPGLLTNATLRRFPAIERTGNTPTTPSAAKDNYYRIARTETGVVLSGLEQIHLSVFCCGVGFNEPFVLPLLLRLEEMLRRESEPPEEDPNNTTTATRDTSSKETNPNSNAAGHSDEEFGSSSVPSPVGTNAYNTNFHENGSFYLQSSHSLLSRRHRAQRYSIPNRHWRTVTCVLLLKPSFEEQGELMTLPLFRCIKRDLLSDAAKKDKNDNDNNEDNKKEEENGAGAALPRERMVPSWLQEAGLLDSYLKRVHIETTWMNETPAYMLHFKFCEQTDGERGGGAGAGTGGKEDSHIPASSPSKGRERNNMPSYAKEDPFYPI